MKPLSCYILDDEQHAVDALTAMLNKKFTSQIVVCGSSIRANEAVAEVERLSPDILFIDVEMPELTGIEFLQHFPEKSFQIIFTTAHEKYALPALKAYADDYLLKPLSPQEVFEAIQRCINKKQKADSSKISINQKINLSVSQETLLVNVDDIVRVEANNNYSHFYFTNRPKLIVSKTLKEFDDQLKDHNFFRIHQSHLINLAYLEAVKSKDGDFVQLQFGHKVEISRRKKAAFLQKLKEL